MSSKRERFVGVDCAEFVAGSFRLLGVDICVDLAVASYSPSESIGITSRPLPEGVGVVDGRYGSREDDLKVVDTSTSDRRGKENLIVSRNLKAAAWNSFLNG